MAETKSLRRLGVVLDQHAENHSEIVQAFVVQYAGTNDVWHVYTEGTKTFRAKLCLLAYSAMTRLSEVESAGREQVLVAKQSDEKYGFLAGFFADLTSRTDAEGGVSASPRFKAAITHTLRLRGWKPHAEVYAPTSLTQDSFFFWTLKDYQERTGKKPLDNDKLLTELPDRGTCPRLASSFIDLIAKVRAYASGVRPWELQKFEYLRHIEHEQILDIRNTKGEWFRPTGPTSADFEAGYVHLRAEEDADFHKLKTALGQGKHHILVGVSASGKTVLVRQLAYELYKHKEYSDIWFVNCGLRKRMALWKLSVEISQVTGLLIVDDAHLFPWEVDDLYHEVRRRPNMDMLIVARPSLWDGLVGKPNVALTELEHSALALAPFTCAGQIIESFRAHHPGLPWTPEAIESLKEHSKTSYWLLAWALKGYDTDQGKGNPQSWPRDGVQGHLRGLNNLNTYYPRGLLALAPLYLGETMTAESYLEDRLGFDPNVFRRLARRGEITWAEEYGKTFYGLPHSGLAEAYWEHGETYRTRLRQPELVGFLSDYLTSDTPDAMAAISAAGMEIQERVWQKVHSAGKLMAVIEKEAPKREDLRPWVSILHSRQRLEGSVMLELFEKVTAVMRIEITYRTILAVQAHYGSQTARSLCTNLGAEPFGQELAELKEDVPCVSSAVWLPDSREGPVQTLCEVTTQERLVARIGAIGQRASLLVYVGCILKQSEVVPAPSRIEDYADLLVTGFGLSGPPSDSKSSSDQIAKTNPESFIRLFNTVRVVLREKRLSRLSSYPVWSYFYLFTGGR